jgi:putative flippase GtrA
LRSFIKFGALSGGGWLLDCFLLLLLTAKLSTPLTIANFISSSVAALSVFTISKFLVFKPNGASPILKTFIYFGYTCAVILLASVIIGPAAWLVKRTADYLAIELAPGQLTFIAKVLITPPQLLANFLMSRYLVEHARGGAEIV